MWPDRVIVAVSDEHVVGLNMSTGQLCVKQLVTSPRLEFLCVDEIVLDGSEGTNPDRLPVLSIHRGFLLMVGVEDAVVCVWSMYDGELVFQTTIEAAEIGRERDWNAAEYFPGVRAGKSRFRPAAGLLMDEWVVIIVNGVGLYEGQYCMVVAYPWSQPENKNVAVVYSTMKFWSIERDPVEGIVWLLGECGPASLVTVLPPSMWAIVPSLDWIEKVMDVSISMDMKRMVSCYHYSLKWMAVQDRNPTRGLPIPAWGKSRFPFRR